MSERFVTTYSMWSLFRNCRKACEWRYVNELVPLKSEHCLSFGSLIHECLEKWHRKRDLAMVLDHIDRSLSGRSSDECQKADWHLARAMMTGYASTYPVEDFDVVFLEKTFEGKIVNPATDSPSRSFVLAGKVDGIVCVNGKFYLLEHKTASQMDGDYLEKLWGDFQVCLYAYYVEQVFGIRIAGIIYNILVKARLQQSKGETEAEFEVRRADLIAKSKTGRTSATRKMPESDADFQARLAAKYAEPGMFHRETLYISRDQFDTLRTDLWELTQQFLDCRRRRVFYQNTSYCFFYHRPCPYFALCRSNGSSNVIENFYEHKAAHEELREEPVEVEDIPVF
ncbi:MAG: PD-(D/E)XK nuclease family protein [Armatimonadota bacterium]|nr:PD-(D/E)XK nuclease family protein [bacterium]